MQTRKLVLAAGIVALTILVAGAVFLLRVV